MLKNHTNNIDNEYIEKVELLDALGKLEDKYMEIML